ncbi:MAG TPA: hypothetical protein DET40_03305 [Lentisphaeria bacterium]|nr:MAG: hypothetical protein A2X45_22185 [Lentisphaerae bacterium GWF2_50_93]HCE42558.1 hypothetical protein [Lentisphaeria bacterium]
MKKQAYNWQAMVRDIMDEAFLPQEEMAAKLKVSQQTISNWLNGMRRPKEESIPELLKLAGSSGIEISSYVANPEFDRINEYLSKNRGRDLKRLFDLYGKMSKANRLKFLRHVERMGR